MNLEDKTLAKCIAKTQETYNFPGLITECKEIMEKLRIKDKNPQNYTKNQWKTMIKEKVQEKGRKELLNKVKNLKKIDYHVLKEEDYTMKEYMKTLNLHDARLRFRIRINLVPGFKYLYKSTPAFRQSLWECPLCKNQQEYNLDNLSHSLNCPQLADIHLNEPEDDQQIVNYFRLVIKRREDLS